MANRARGISSPLLAMLATVFGSWSSAAADRPVVVPIRLLGNFPVVIVNIGGNDVPLVFDSGNSGSVALTQAVIDRVKALPTGETSKGMDPKGNVIEYPKFKIPRLQIGSAIFTDVIGSVRWLHGNGTAFLAGVARGACRRGGYRSGEIDGVVGYRNADIDS